MHPQSEQNGDNGAESSGTTAGNRVAKGKGKSRRAPG